jgi:hypothetical protein
MSFDLSFASVWALSALVLLSVVGCSSREPTDTMAVPATKVNAGKKANEARAELKVLELGEQARKNNSIFKLINCLKKILIC